MLSSIDTGGIAYAFEAMGHPDAVPIQTWEDDNGTTYQKLLKLS